MLKIEVKRTFDARYLTFEDVTTFPGRLAINRHGEVVVPMYYDRFEYDGGAIDATGPFAPPVTLGAETPLGRELIRRGLVYDVPENWERDIE